MSWKRALAGFAVALPIVALLLYGLSRDPREIPSPLPGRDAPPFALRTLEKGDTVTLADLRGEVVVLNFWASWCIPCRYEHPHLLAASELYGHLGVRFLGLLYQDTPGNARAWLAELGEAYPSLLDDRSRAAIEYGVTGVPETFVIDQEGKVRYKKVGPVTLDELRAAIDPLVNGATAAAELEGSRPQ